MRMRRLGLIAPVPLLCLALSACGGGSDTGSTGSGEGSAEGPIKVGNVSSLTGGLTFPEPSEAAGAYFEKVNEEGGIDGRELEFEVVDDKGEPSGASQAALNLTETGVVANVASASALECSVNGKAYEKAGMISVQGLGSDYGCFHSPNIAPVNPGPFVASALELVYASDVLKKEQVCFAAPNFPGYGPGYAEAVEAWEQITGKTLVVDERQYDITADPTPLILKLKNAGCEAVAMIGSEPNGVPFFKAVEAQKAQDIAWVWPTTIYSSTFLKVGGKSVEDADLSIFSEFRPWSEKSDQALKPWRDLMAANGIPQTSNAISGYAAAEVFVDVLKTIKGPITRESVTEAFKSMEEGIDSPLLGSPWIFGPGDSHSPESAGKFLQVENGEFVLESPEWISLPEGHELG